MHPPRYGPKLFASLMLVFALLLPACQKTAPTPPTADAPAPDTLSEEQVDKYTAQIDEAVELFDSGLFDEGIGMLEAIVAEAPATADAISGLLEMMEESHPSAFDTAPYLGEGAVSHERRLVTLVDDMPPLLLDLYEVPATESYNAAIFSFDPEDWVWSFETAVVPDDCWFVSGLETELRGVGKELVMYGHCDPNEPKTEILTVWARDGGWMGTWESVYGPAELSESLDLITGRRYVEARSGVDVLRFWWDGDDFDSEYGD